MITLPTFTQQGRCAADNLDPELFFPISEADTHRIERAKAVCADCPVRTECLTFALRHGEHGIWGGLTDAERATARRTPNRDTAREVAA